MTMAFDLDKYNIAAANLVEVYFANAPSTLDLTTIFGNGSMTKTIEYHMCDLCYSYDTANDGQRVTRRIPLNYDDIAHGIVAIVYNEETLPSHRFPCTNDINQKNVVEKRSYRVNNRTHVLHEVGGSLYIQYRHSQVVDTKEQSHAMTQTIAKVMRLLKST